MDLPPGTMIANHGALISGIGARHSRRSTLGCDNETDTLISALPTGRDPGTQTDRSDKGRTSTNS